MHQCDLRQDSARTYRKNLEFADPESIRDLYDQMKKEVVDILLKQNIGVERIVYEKTVDMRYIGQDYTLNVEFNTSEITKSSIEELKQVYNTYHQQVYGHHNPNGAIETVNIRLAGIGLIDRIAKVPMQEKENPLILPYKMASVIFSNQHYETGIFRRNCLPPGTNVDGPAIIEELSSTTVLPPGYSMHVNGYENMVIHKV